LASSAANEGEEESTRVAARPMAIERWRIITPPSSGKPSGRKRQFQKFNGHTRVS
jgi:hypothetical protein